MRQEPKKLENSKSFRWMLLRKLANLKHERKARWRQELTRLLRMAHSKLCRSSQEPKKLVSSMRDSKLLKKQELTMQELKKPANLKHERKASLIQELMKLLRMAHLKPCRLMLEPKLVSSMQELKKLAHLKHEKVSLR
jgi:hypothetical protein